jgi:hypothetical protein
MESGSKRSPEGSNFNFVRTGEEVEERLLQGAPVKAKAQGMINRLFGLRKRKGAPTQPTSDLTPYRRRAAELLELLRIKTTADDAERLTALAQVVVKLAELVTDLKSVGTDASEVQPLERLLTDLQHSLGKPQPSGELVRLWTEAETVLHAFSGDPLAPSATRRRESFWK